MPDFVAFFNVTCAASVPATVPTITTFTHRPGIPRKATIIIPDGHAGTTGIALGYGQQPVIPLNPGGYFSSNDEYIPLDLHGYPPGPIWQAFTCNNDLQPHVWGVFMEFDEIPTGTVVDAPAVIPATDIVSAGNSVLGGV